MFDHICLRVQSYEKSKEFFVRILEPLGVSMFVDEPEKKDAGFGKEDKDGQRKFWIYEEDVESKPSFSCLAFVAPNKEAVDQFYKRAIDLGAADNGNPGYRERYGRGYYAAYIIDENGYNIEAVFNDESI